MDRVGLESYHLRTNALEDTTSVSPLVVLPHSRLFLTTIPLVDVGASQFIIDGKIKLKNGTTIKEFTKTGLKFEDDTTLDADLVVFATGLGDAREEYKRLLGDELGGKLKQIWGLDSSGELKGVWRDVGIDNLWSMMGNLAMCRYHSRHVALREFFFTTFLPLLFLGTESCGITEIKAIKEGLFTGRYSLEED